MMNRSRAIELGRLPAEQAARIAARMQADGRLPPTRPPADVLLPCGHPAHGEPSTVATAPDGTAYCAVCS